MLVQLQTRALLEVVISRRRWEVKWKVFVLVW